MTICYNNRLILMHKKNSDKVEHTLSPFYYSVISESESIGSVVASIGMLPSQSVQISSAEAPLQFTNVSPTVAVAPNATGTATQIFWLIVNAQVPFFVPPQVILPGVTTGSPQQVVAVTPVSAKGLTVTGTQIEADWYPTDGHVAPVGSGNVLLSLIK